jgi:hypothetical protein
MVQRGPSEEELLAMAVVLEKLLLAWRNFKPEGLHQISVEMTVV